MDAQPDRALIEVVQQCLCTTADGNLISKHHRDIAVESGFILRSCGLNVITTHGIRWLEANRVLPDMTRCPGWRFKA